MAKLFDSTLEAILYKSVKLGLSLSFKFLLRVFLDITAADIYSNGPLI